MSRVVLSAESGAAEKCQGLPLLWEKLTGCQPFFLRPALRVEALGVRLRFPSQPEQHRHVASAQKTHFK